MNNKTYDDFENSNKVEDDKILCSIKKTNGLLSLIAMLLFAQIIIKLFIVG